jgi:hypothetical protein
MTDLLAEVGKFALFLLQGYYGLMLWFHSAVSPSVGVAASFLVTGLLFAVLPLIVVVQVLMWSASESHSLFEWGWERTIWVLLVIVAAFLILVALK